MFDLPFRFHNTMQETPPIPTPPSPQQWRALLHELAPELGFSAVGVASVDRVDHSTWQKRKKAVSQEHYSSLSYIDNYPDIRQDPSLLLPEARSIIVTATNYYPPQKQKAHSPQIAYYAYGKDYHKVVKKQLTRLAERLQAYTQQPIGTRIVCDSAPFMDQYWAVRAGIGYVGKSGLLIIPKQGSFFFLGSIIVDIEISPDTPYDKNLCGHCTRCIDHCPAQAIRPQPPFGANKCISCLTIEDRRKELLPEEKKRIGNRLYGCDICQQVCPHNRWATAHQNEKFSISPHILSLRYENLYAPSEALFENIASGSAIRRIGYEQFKRNTRIVLEWYFRSLPQMSPWRFAPPTLPLSIKKRLYPKG